MGKSKIVRRKAKRRRDIKRKQRPDPDALVLPDYATKPTEERMAKVDAEFISDEPTEIAGTTAKRFNVLDAFDHLYQRRWLMNKAAGEDEEDNQMRYDAGMRLREDFRRAGLPSKVIANYKDMIACGSIVQHFADGSIDARRRFFAASAAVDPTIWWTVRDCAVEGKTVGPHLVERLRIGLEQLRRHYGL